MRYELTEYEWSALPNKARGVPRVDDRRVLNGIFGCWDLARHGVICRNVTAHILPAITASSAGGELAYGAGSWTRLLPLMMPPSK